ALRFEIGFGANDEEAARFVKAKQARKIGEAAVHDVESARFRQQLIEDIDLVQLAVAYMNKTRDIAAQIEQRVHLHGGFGRAKWRPRKHRQTQIDRGGIEGVNGVLQ